MNASWALPGSVDVMEVSGLDASDTNNGEPPGEPAVPDGLL